MGVGSDDIDSDSDQAGMTENPAQSEAAVGVEPSEDDAPSDADRRTPRLRTLSRRSAVTLCAHLWVVPPLAVLIVVRALLVFDDPSDFPMDRNINLTGRLQHAVTQSSLVGILRIQPPESPEFPFLPIMAVKLTALGLEPLAAARVFSLVASLLTGLGLYVLGRRVGPPAAGALTLWLFALAPMSVFMGRGLLPDTFMVAALVWSIVAAGAGRRGVSPWAALGMAMCLIIAGLAKLPGLFMAPAAGLALMQAVGWRRIWSWVGLVLAALATYAIVCLWYEINPAAPLEGLDQMSRNTNNMLASKEDLLSVEAMQILLSRLILTLTLPGTFLLLFGAILLNTRRGNRLWINAWLLTSLVFVVLTIRANVYWAYAAAPMGCFVAALGLIELGRLSRWSLALTGVLSLAALLVCPGVKRVSGYLSVQPVYREAAEVAREKAGGGKILYDGRVPEDLSYFVGRRGASLQNQSPSQAQAKLDSGSFHYLLSLNMLGTDRIGRQFDRKPVLATHATDYVLYHTGKDAKLGTPMPLGPERANHPHFNLNHNLDDRLIIQLVVVEPIKPKPGELVDLKLDFVKGPQYQPNLNLTAVLIHEPTGANIPLMPVMAGAYFVLWPRPLLQVPDFKDAERERMRYQFVASPHLPVGPYSIRFALVPKRNQYSNLRNPVTVNVKLAIPTRPADQLPLGVDLTRGVWEKLLSKWGPSWRGQPHRLYNMVTNTKLWLAPSLLPGDYELAVTARGKPAGSPSREGRWPIVQVYQPGRKERLKFEFNTGLRRTIRRGFRWNGPQDFLLLNLKNPLYDPSRRRTFPLYSNDLTGGDRGALIERIEIREVVYDGG